MQTDIDKWRTFAGDEFARSFGEIIEANAENIPTGDYVRMYNALKVLHERSAPRKKIQIDQDTFLAHVQTDIEVLDMSIAGCRAKMKKIQPLLDRSRVTAVVRREALRKVGGSMKFESVKHERAFYREYLAYANFSNSEKFNRLVTQIHSMSNKKEKCQKSMEEVIARIKENLCN